MPANQGPERTAARAAKPWRSARRRKIEQLGERALADGWFGLTFGAFGVLQLLQWTGVIDVSWWWLTAPFWIPGALLLAGGVYAVALSFVAAAVHVGRQCVRRRGDST
jgi:hypothetical protein